MGKGVLLTIVILLIIGATYSYRRQQKEQVKVDTSSVTTETTFSLAQQNNSYESGTVELRGKGRATIVTINLSGAPTEAQPAHIHQGACPVPGAVLYSLSPVINGKSVTTLNTPIAELQKQVPLAVNVHRSAADLKAYVACGDIFTTGK